MNTREKLEVLAWSLFPQEEDRGCNGLLQPKPHRESSTAEAIDCNHLPGSAVWFSKAWCEKSANACLAWRSPENKSQWDRYFIFLHFETCKTSSSSNGISASDPSRAALWSCLCWKDEKPSLVITNLWSLAVVGSMPCGVEYGDLVSPSPRSLQYVLVH